MQRNANWVFVVAVGVLAMVTSAIAGPCNRHSGGSNHCSSYGDCDMYGYHRTCNGGFTVDHYEVDQDCFDELYDDAQPKDDEDDGGGDNPCPNKNSCDTEPK